MKNKFRILVVAFFCAAQLMFADTYVEKQRDGKITVTFFYGNPRATEVLLAGSFTSWQSAAIPMEKRADGFYATVTADEKDTLVYKFISDGSWTQDLRAPDSVDDGFGGYNSLVDIAKQLKRGKKQKFSGKYKN